VDGRGKRETAGKAAGRPRHDGAAARRPVDVEAAPSRAFSHPPKLQVKATAATQAGDLALASACPRRAWAGDGAAPQSGQLRRADEEGKNPVARAHVA